MMMNMTRNRFLLGLAGLLSAALARAQTKLASAQVLAVGTGRVWVSYQDQLRQAKLLRSGAAATILRARRIGRLAPHDDGCDEPKQPGQAAHLLT